MNQLYKLIWRIRSHFATRYSGGVADAPDLRDYPAGSPGISKMPKKVDLYAKAKEHGFKLVQQSTNSCTAYGLIFIVEIMNCITHEKNVILNKEYQWALQKITGGSDESGDLLQNALKQFKKDPQGYPILEYRRIKEKGVDVVKKWLAIGFPVYTAVYWISPSIGGKSNWALLVIEGIYYWLIGKAIGAHQMSIIGYDDDREVFLAVQALVEEVPFEYTEIPYEVVTKTMSQYVLFDAKSHEEDDKVERI